MTTPSADARTALIDAIIADYHTTRMSETPAAQHILTKWRSKEAFARFEAHLRSTSPASDTEAMRLLLVEVATQWRDRQSADLLARIDAALANGGAA